MERKVLNLKGSVKGKVISVGIDVHSLSWQVTALADSEVIMAVTISKPDYSKLKALLARLQGNILRVAYEAGPAGFDLYDKLRADGIECIVVPPSLIPIESGNRVKNDKLDIYKLENLLESTRFEMKEV